MPVFIQYHIRKMLLLLMMMMLFGCINVCRMIRLKMNSFIMMLLFGKMFENLDLLLNRILTYIKNIVVVVVDNVVAVVVGTCVFFWGILEHRSVNLLL